jgi:flavin reductase (DIM6/NTAB) family NADH-FMN oxidoreductase RutF
MRQDVPLPQAYRLLNHGPTVLVSAAHGGRRNLMAAAWAMPLDFSPPKVAVVLDKSTFTRQLIEAAGSFALNLPCRAQADLAYTVGSCSGAELDKFEALGIASFAGREIEAPLVEGCVAWLECRLLPQPALQAEHDLFLGEVVAAQADTRAWAGGRWQYRDGAEADPALDALRTLHHIAAGRFFTCGEQVQGHTLFEKAHDDKEPAA